MVWLGRPIPSLLKEFFSKILFLGSFNGALAQTRLKTDMFSFGINRFLLQKGWIQPIFLSTHIFFAKFLIFFY